MKQGLLLQNTNSCNHRASSGGCGGSSSALRQERHSGSGGGCRRTFVCCWLQQRQPHRQQIRQRWRQTWRRQRVGVCGRRSRGLCRRPWPLHGHSHALDTPADAHAGMSIASEEFPINDRSLQCQTPASGMMLIHPDCSCTQQQQLPVNCWRDANSYKFLGREGVQRSEGVQRMVPSRCRWRSCWRRRGRRRHCGRPRRATSVLQSQRRRLLWKPQRRQRRHQQRLQLPRCLGMAACASVSPQQVKVCGAAGMSLAPASAHNSCSSSRTVVVALQLPFNTITRRTLALFIL